MICYIKPYPQHFERNVIYVSINNIEFTVPSTHVDNIFDAIRRTGIKEFVSLVVFNTPSIVHSPGFCTFITQPSITNISLVDINMTQTDFEKFCATLSSHPSDTLNNLDLQFNSITDIRMLVSVITTHPNLRQIKINNNPVSDVVGGVRHLLDLSPFHSSSIAVIDVSFCANLTLEDGRSLQRLIWTIPRLVLFFSTTEPLIPRIVPRNPTDIIFIKEATKKQIPPFLIRRIIIMSSLFI